MNRGMSNLAKNFSTYTKTLKNADKGTAEYSETMDALKTDFADIFNLADKDMVSDEFM